ncbi:SprT family protein [Sporosarcina sp. HYO08]|uniref:SprT family protein n=1 Tax=Sporosarcina sp. HYO08 TaxID=1759557 RepID=UPI000795AB91|nr:SprT family protein [Sporosarcina sp. HYO08]KXH80961.1 SprT family protein [Sporosarcina sp. HYO08]
MDNNQLQQLIEEISIGVFGKAFHHTARFNERLRTTGGRYLLSDHSIEINPRVLELHGQEELRGVIKHELCHYHLHIEGKGYQHGDQDFKKLLKETASPRYCKPLAAERRRATALHIYQCRSCKLLYRRRRRMDTKKYRCGKCMGSIIKVNAEV